MLGIPGSLPNWIVMANSNTFKRRLDTYWRLSTIFHAELQGTGSRSDVFRYD